MRRRVSQLDVPNGNSVTIQLCFPNRASALITIGAASDAERSMVLLAITLAYSKQAL